MTTTMTSPVLKVNREKLAACMTCPLCNKLFRDATTISECLHSFCGKCIYEKITEEDLDSCPVCNTDLGCDPLEKLREDHNMQDLRFKIFPSKRKNNAPDIVSSVPLAARRKERSLSSLVVSTPKLPANSSSSGRRLKTGPRKTLAVEDSAFSFEKPVKDVENSQEILSSSEIPNKPTQDKRQISSAAETSNQKRPDKSTEDSTEPLDGKADLWKPLNVLVEAVSKTKSNKFNSQGTVGRPILLDANANANELLPKAKPMECVNASKVHGNENNAIPGSSGSVKPRKSQGRPKKAAVSEGLNFSAQAVIDAYSTFDGRFGPIWFSLVASDEQDEPLPQISSCYLRVKDGSLPVSFIKKYLVKKLNLASEAEVEISLQGQPVLSTLQLHNLVTWWIQTTSASERIQTSVGSSAKDFVMVLSYGRKAQPPLTFFKNA